VNKCPAIVANKSRTFAARHGVPPMGYRAVEGISAGQTGQGHPNRFGAGQIVLWRLGRRLTVHGLRPGPVVAENSGRNRHWMLGLNVGWEREHPKTNIQHRTSNEAMIWPEPALGVRCSMFDVFQLFLYKFPASGVYWMKP
jgi:hypothetical protein